MAGVEVLWQGCCCDHQTQRQLVEKVIQLGKLSKETHLESYLFDGETSYDNVLFSTTVFEGERCPKGLRRLDDAVYLAEKVRFYGAEIQIITPAYQETKSRHQSNDKLSFVFVRSQNPELDGRLVCPKRKNPHHPLYNEGDWVLESPSIDLGGLSQEWMADFLGWVRRYYVPGMRYWVGMQECTHEASPKVQPQHFGELEVQFEELARRFSDQIQDFSEAIEESRKARMLSERTSKKVINQGERLAE